MENIDKLEKILDYLYRSRDGYYILIQDSGEWVFTPNEKNFTVSVLKNVIDNLTALNDGAEP